MATSRVSSVEPPSAIEDDAPLVLVVPGQAVGDHLDDVLDGALVVVAGDAHEDIGGFDLLDAFEVYALNAVS